MEIVPELLEDVHISLFGLVALDGYLASLVVLLVLLHAVEVPALDLLGVQISGAETEISLRILKLAF
jgi:hypothetical protein